MQEFCTLCVLPYSCAANAKFHVSLFISPSLRPDTPVAKLSSFTMFPHWAAVMKSETTFMISDQSGSLDAVPLLDDIDPALWDAVFPPDTPVRRPVVPDWSQRMWRSFSARFVHDLGKGVQLATFYTHQTTPPAPPDHPLTGPLMEIAGRYFRPDPHIKKGRERRFIYDESLMSADLDTIVESRESLAEKERIIAAETNPMRRIALELARARRYYERPEAQRDYQERPTPGKVSPPVDRPEPEFHERCAMAGDHPTLLRRLGLVIDMKVADPARLRNTTFLSGKIGPRDDPTVCLRTRTRCRAVGEDLVTVASTPDWIDGMARLGDEELFAMLELDADGTALKLERFLWTIPRLLAVHSQDAPANAANPALRASGFTVVRKGQAIDTQQRLDRQHSLEKAVEGAVRPDLTTEDVTRGLRVEVWDDTARRWESLHSRLTTVKVAGHGTVLDEVPEEGFIQGTAAHENADVVNSPIHVHEAVFGWEGWSLSAPRPGRRVRHENGDEIVEDVPETEPDPVHPVLIRNRVRPGTLPRLRFGRSYMMRAWAVDLAGNSRPHELNPAPAPAGSISGALAAALAGQPATVDVLSRLPSELRGMTSAAIARRRAAEVQETTALLFESPEHEEIVRARLSELRLSRSPIVSAVAAGIDRRTLVADAIEASVADLHQPFIVDPAVRAPSALEAVVASHVNFADTVPRSLETLTPLRPFLRWDPVASPAVVPVRRYTEGESVRVLVVRSGVTQDPKTLEITVTPPDEYAASVPAALGYTEQSERHLAPPKTTQVQAELHGMFDEAIGSPNPTDHQRLLGIALLENGSFLDLDIADIDNPPQRVAQPGVRLEMQAGTPHADPVTLPLPHPGDPLPPGQYVVHDTPELTLPYLPDPLARGVSFVFQEAGLDRKIPWLHGTEGFTARYSGDWPEIEPFRLVLGGAEQLAGKVDGRVISVALSPGDVQRFRLASSLDRAELALFGLWRSLPQGLQGALPELAEAAADGWLWALTPFEEVTLLHAVPRPLQGPRPTKLLPFRGEGITLVVLLGAVDLDGASTGLLTAEASWTDQVDDLTLPIWEKRPTAGVAFTSPVLPYEEIALLGPTELDGIIDGFGRIHSHAAIHQLGDTKHRVIEYRFRASTRFREYFHPDLLAPDASVPGDDGQSVVGPKMAVSIPSAARPAPPIVHSVVPLLRWSDGTEPEQPVARRHGRRAGVRIFLERPWFSSGAGELLGVLLAPRSNDEFGPPPEDQSGFPWVSKWGGDPAWRSAPVERRPLRSVQLDNLLHFVDTDEPPEPGRPVTAPKTLPLASLPDKPMVDVVGYQPQYNAERKLWYVDVALDPGSTFWPFVRLAVCRYQPESIDGCHLSAPARCDFVQLLPERTTSVSRTDDRHVRVVVSGPVGVIVDPESVPDPFHGPEAFAKAVGANRQVVARLQRRDPAIPTDLGWKTVATAELAVRGRGATQFEAAWVGELDAGKSIPLVRPGDNLNWRVTVEEWERLPGDPASVAEGGAPFSLFFSPIWERRLIYADEVSL
jgi:hypothetical protein